MQLLEYCTGWVRAKTKTKTNAYARLPAHCIYSIIIFIIWSLLLILFYILCTLQENVMLVFLFFLRLDFASTVHQQHGCHSLACYKNSLFMNWTKDCVCLSANTVHFICICMHVVNAHGPVAHRNLAANVVTQRRNCRRKTNQIAGNKNYNSKNKKKAASQNRFSIGTITSCCVLWLCALLSDYNVFVCMRSAHSLLNQISSISCTDKHSNQVLFTSLMLTYSLLSNKKHWFHQLYQSIELWFWPR